MTRRILCFFISLIIFCTQPFYALASISPAAVLNISPVGDQEQVIEIPKNQQAVLNADRELESLVWQVQSSDHWITIYNENTDSCQISYAMMKSILDADNSCKIRCISESQELISEYKVQFTDPEIEEEEFKPVFQILSDTVYHAEEIETEPLEIVLETEADTKTEGTETTPETTLETTSETTEIIIETESESEETAERTESVEETSDEAEETLPVAEENRSDTETKAEVRESVAPEETLPPAIENDQAEETLPDPSDYSTEAVKDTSGVRKSAQNLFVPVGDPMLAATAEPYLIEIEYKNEDGELIMHPWRKVVRGHFSEQTISFPEINGYEPYINCEYDKEQRKWVGGEQSSSIFIDSPVVPEDVLITVVYKPGKVNFMVNYNTQHVDDEQYDTITEMKQSLTGEKVDVKSLAVPKEGFSEMWYDEPVVLANGSTSVDIYYDRNYYLMNLKLEGGYGSEPIYARFGTTISIADPKKPGYKFVGWQDEEGNVGTLPTTMPSHATDFTAVWKAEEMTDVTLMFWGENPDKPGTYDYMDSVKGKTEAEQKVDAFQVPICGKEEHHHSAACCILPNHEHTAYCYRNIDKPEDWLPPGIPENPFDGQTVQIESYGDVNYYVYHVQYPKSIVEHPDTSWKNNYTGWYTYSPDGPVRCKLHVHGDGHCYCPIPEHKHDESCYLPAEDSELWSFSHQDDVVAKPDGSSIVNVYYDRKEFTLNFKEGGSEEDNKKEYGSITAKWGANIQQEFSDVSEEAGSNVWSRKSTGGSPWIANVQIMPAENIDYYCPEKVSTETSTAYYRGLKLGGDRNNPDDYEIELIPGGNKANGKNLTITEQDFLEFQGYQINKEQSPDIDVGDKPKPLFDKAVFRYERIPYNIAFVNNGEVVRTETVLFEEPISRFKDFEPAYPSNLEPGGFQFDGWYRDPGFRDPVKWDDSSLVMPAKNVTLYAKWVPVKHTVKFYDNEEDMLSDNNALATIQVEHGSTSGITGDPVREDLYFVSWFFHDDNGKEHAFDGKKMPIKSDLKLYAKWTSKVMVDFIVKYGVKNPDGSVTEIGSPTTGRILGGVKKMFYPKTGPELYSGYKNSYYPTESEKNILLNMDPDTVNEIWFYYEYREPPIPYTVRYLSVDTGMPLIDDEHYETLDALIYVDFKPIKDHIPDAFTKKLYISPDEKKNIVTFWYTEDTVHAPMRYTYWIEDEENSGYQIYSDNMDLMGDIGTTYEIPEIEIPGFVENTAHEDRKISDKLTSEGLHLQRFYDRQPYPYEILFLEEGTNQELTDSDNNKISKKKGTAKVGTQIMCEPEDIKGWRCINPDPYPMTITIEENNLELEYNVYTFYYKKIADKVSLTIRNRGCNAIDQSQEFIFHLKGIEEATKLVDLEVAVAGNGSTTIVDMPPGKYKLEQQNTWSWRYTSGKGEFILDIVQDDMITFQNERQNRPWMNGMDYNDNKWTAHKKED